MNKNIFFLFPPGYSGNYLQWICNISEQSKKHATIKDPLRPDGTSHGFARRPTHMALFNVLSWIIKNQPTDAQTFAVYATNDAATWADHPGNAAFWLLRSYPEGLCVNIHAANDDELKVGALNGYTKWNVWMYDLQTFYMERSPHFDWEGGKNKIISITDRNWLFENWRKFFVLNSTPFNWEELKFHINANNQWYNIREEMDPGDMSADQFNNFEIFPDNNIFDISLGELYHPDFFKNSKFFQWVESQNAGIFDWSYAESYHQTYLDAQDNLKWFTKIEDMRNNKQVSKWLLQNTLSQAFLLEEVATRLTPGWKESSTEDILTALGYKIVN